MQHPTAVTLPDCNSGCPRAAGPYVPNYYSNECLWEQEGSCTVALDLVWLGLHSGPTDYSYLITLRAGQNQNQNQNFIGMRQSIILSTYDTRRYLYARRAKEPRLTP